MRRTRGQGLTEYAALLVGLVLVAIVGVTVAGAAISTTYQKLNTALGITTDIPSPAPSPTPTPPVLSGTVTGAGGAALSGVKVYVYDATNAALVVIATTSASGTYSITLATGTYKVWFQANRVDYVDTWYGGTTFTNSTTVTLNANAPVNIALGNPALSGTVTTLATGLPVVGATVSAWNATTGAWTRAGVTNGAGLYTITLPVGSYNLYVQPTSGPARWFGGTSKETATDVVLPAANTTQNITVN